MRILLVILGICALVGTAVAEKPPQDPVQYDRVECNFESIYGVNNWGEEPGPGTPNACDPGGGLPVWEWGIPVGIPAPPAPFGPNVWGTVLGGDYLNDAGEGFLSQPFLVTVGVNELAELVHYFDIETNYDGCNIVVVEEGGEETILIPIGGYPATISTSTGFYAWCVDMEEGWTDHVAAWTTDCADLTPWDGQTIQLRADFGSDNSVTYPGWYIAGYTVGSAEATPVDESTWGEIKDVFK